MLPDFLKFTVIVDDISQYSRLFPSHGLSIYIELPLSKEKKLHIMFDTGSNFQILDHNAKILGIRYDLLDYVIISLWRKCHIGGLLTNLKTKGDMKIIVPPLHTKRSNDKLRKKGYLLSSDFKHDVLELLGPLGNRIKEYALIVKLRKSLVIFTGCLRFGIEELFKQLYEKGYTQVHAIVGGLNISVLDVTTLEYLRKAVEDFQVKIIYPLHSTAPQARRIILKNLFDLDMECGVGLSATIP